jgi:hypothetical protein
MSGNLRVFSKNFFRQETITRAIRVAIIVAPILIFINHYDDITSLRFAPVFFLNRFLRFLFLILFLLTLLRKLIWI